MKKDLTLLILAVFAIGGFIWAMNEHTKRLLLAEKFDRKGDDYLNLMATYLKDKKEMPKEIKNQLINLRKEYSGINDAVALKLQAIIELIQDGKNEIAIEKLTLIIENLLKDKYVKEGKAKDNKSCPSLFGLLKYALEVKWITKHQFSFSLFLKDKRNEEAHELTTSFSVNDKYIAFLAGIEIIYKLNGIKRVA